MLYANQTNGEPIIKDSALKADLVTEGLSSPTSMAFVEYHKILVLEKNTGVVRLVENSTLQEKPVLKLRIDHTTPTCCRGLLGIAVTDPQLTFKPHDRMVYLYFSELLSKGTVKNRVYRYEWDGKFLFNPTLILDLPATPGPDHPGGKLAIGKDGFLYTIIGDQNNEGLLQNIKGNAELTDTSVIPKINPNDGKSSPDNPFFNSGLSESAQKYYAYGIRNSFGLALDPVTGFLWDTENGDMDYDEINYIPSGFNSGWKKIMGPLSESRVSQNDLVRLPNSNYLDPAFSFAPSLGITAIEFLNSSHLGAEYQNNIFVGDITHGNLYFFKLNSTRKGLQFLEDSQSDLKDLVANGNKELSQIAFGTGFKGITDIKTGPDGLLYVLTFDQNNNGKGSIYRISPS